MKGVSLFGSFKRWGALFSFALIGVVIGFAISTNTGLINKGETQVQSARATAPAKSIYPITADGRSPFVSVVENVRDAVVNIRAEIVEQVPLAQRRWLEFWGYPTNWRETSMGTGFFFREDGYLLTNYHVIGGAREIVVTLADRSEVKARVIGEDPASDLAVLKINGSGYPNIELGDSDSIKVGEWVMAIGNPFPSAGLDRTVTVGVVSAKGRHGLDFGENSPVFQDYIQTDAAINPGNSGGPLVNLDGYVIGINAAIASASGQSAGIGFAIPSNFVRTVAADLMTQGKVSRGYLGVDPGDINQSLAEANGLPNPRGALVKVVQPNSPAEKAGLRVGDIITKFNDTYVEDAGNFRYLVASGKAGSTADLQVYRKGRPMQLKVLIGDRDQGIAQSQPASRHRQEPEAGAPSSDQEWLGITVETASPELARNYGVPYQKGVIVTDVQPGTPADIVGITPGMILVSINNEDVKTEADYSRLKSQLRNMTAAIPAIAFDNKGNIKYFGIKPQ